MKARIVGIAVLVTAAACGGGDGGPALGTIQGLVRDTAGAPLQEVNVLLRDAGNTTTIRGGLSSASGGYTFVGVTTGSYNIQVLEPPATEVTGLNPVPVAVTASGTAQADFSLRLLPVSFATHVQGVFTGYCVGCHSGGSPPQGLILTTGNAYAMIVGVASAEVPGMKRIKASDPDSSYLVHKLQNTQVSVGGSGARMPAGVPYALPLPTILMIRRWVTAGALNN